MIARSRRLGKTARLGYIANFSYVGTKFVETVHYDADNCQQFSLLLQDDLVEADASSRHRQPLVSRLLMGCLFSRIIGSNLPLSIYLGQEVDYLCDICEGDRVVGEVEVVRSLGHNRYELRTTCCSSEGVLVMDGKATIMLE